MVKINTITSQDKNIPSCSEHSHALIANTISLSSSQSRVQVPFLGFANLFSKKDKLSINEGL